ncbi:hypothetical protein BAOM_1651 [Peribacillus asahii]|uniref:Uncharacterized protein n=1 Tax=Peribacillus asahii TaxID=228899 RepID=A0A3T0KPU0_9BACI|nr:hypothetical protein BAOM_1651 [Peribacillus asahii]
MHELVISYDFWFKGIKNQQGYVTEHCWRKYGDRSKNFFI